MNQPEFDANFDAMIAVLFTCWLIGMVFALAFCLAGAKQDGHIKVRPIFATYDCWIGVYWSSEKRTFYWFPIPMLGLKIYGVR